MWYDDMMMWWYDGMMIWWYDYRRRRWYDDTKVILLYNDTAIKSFLRCYERLPFIKCNKMNIANLRKMMLERLYRCSFHIQFDVSVTLRFIHSEFNLTFSFLAWISPCLDSAKLFVFTRMSQLCRTFITRFQWNQGWGSVQFFLARGSW